MSLEPENAERDPLEQIAESFLARWRAGERPAVSDYAKEYPDLAADIRDVFPALVMMEEGRACVEKDPAAEPASPPTQLPQQLGEYRLLREVGRGGMGVVYEALQESLGRHVALKVLPLNPLVRTEQLERFRREARAAARLHHTNIVPVFGVGEDQGIHYYAMQFIQGQGLDAVLDEVRRLRSKDGITIGSEPVTFVAQGMLSGRFHCTGHATEIAGQADLPSSLPELTAQPSTKHAAASPGSSGFSSSVNIQGPYYASVARIGLQVAEALEYAHGQGVVHRDIKPSNLLLDTEGRVWITDFGLAKAEDVDAMTQSGAIVGTMRYMAPECFQGQADARSDVYALGATLYELLTLRPAFDQPYRGTLADEILHREPLPLRKVDPRIPRDLETSVMKALAKEPERRYATAKEMAEDLRRFLADRPIRARRTPWRERAWRWCRRNPAVAGLLGLASALILVITGGTGLIARDRAAREESIQRERLAREQALDQAVARTLAETGPLMEQEKWAEGLATVDRADKLLAAAGRLERPARLLALRKDLSMADRLEDIYRAPQRNLEVIVLASSHKRTEPMEQPGQASGAEEFYWGHEQDRGFARAFQEFGIDIDGLEPAEAAARIGSTNIHEALVRALDQWAPLRRRARGTKDRGWQKLVVIARRADPDKWRNRFRDASLLRDRQALERLADAGALRDVPPATLWLLGIELMELGAKDKAMAVLRQAQHQYPDDYRINEHLAFYSRTQFRPPRHDDALRFYMIAAALRPRMPRGHRAIADVLRDKGDFADAIAEYSRVIELTADDANAWHYRAFCYYQLRKYDQVLADLNKAIELETKNKMAWYNRGYTYNDLHQHDKAIADFSKAIELDPKFPAAWRLRGQIHRELRQYDKAIADFTKDIEFNAKPVSSLVSRGHCYNQFHEHNKALADLNNAIELNPKYVVAWNNRGYTHNKLHEQDKAIGDLNKAIELNPKYGVAWGNRGAAYGYLHQYDKAFADLNKAIELDPKWAKSWCYRGAIYGQLHQHDKALADLNKSIELDPKFAVAWRVRGQTYVDLRRYDKALADLNKAIELDSRDAEALRDRGNVYAVLGQRDNAAADRAQALLIERSLNHEQH